MPDPVHDAPEHDPTGVRELLAGLPDPGPMPTDLVRRIEARLAVEQAALDQVSRGTLDRRTGQVVDLAAERGRRRPGRTVAALGAVAVGLVAAAVVLPQLLIGQGGESAGTAAHYAGRDEADSVDDDAAGGVGVLSAPDGPDEQREGEAAGGAEPGSAADGDGDDPQQPVVPLVPLDGELVVLPDLGTVEAEEVTRSMLLAMEGHDRAPAASPDLPGGLTEGEAQSCWRVLAASHDFDRYAAARAEFVVAGGQRPPEPVVAVLGLHDDGTARSWVLPEQCTLVADVLPIVEGDPQE